MYIKKNRKTVLLFILLINLNGAIALRVNSSNDNSDFYLINEEEKTDVDYIDNINQESCLDNSYVASTARYDTLSSDEKESNRELGLPENLTKFQVLSFDPELFLDVSIDSASFNIEFGNVVFNFTDQNIENITPGIKKSSILTDIVDEVSIDQIYLIESIQKDYHISLVIDSNVAFGSLTIKDQKYAFEPIMNTTNIKKTNYAFYALTDVINNDLGQVASNDGDTPSTPHTVNYSTNNDKIVTTTADKQSNLAITYSTVNIHKEADVLMVASRSFYDHWGYYTTTKLLSIWDGDGWTDPKSILTDTISRTITDGVDDNIYEIEIEFFTYTHVIFSQGQSSPSSSVASEFLDEFRAYVYNGWGNEGAFDLAWAVTHDSFTGPPAGVAYAGMLGQYDPNEDAGPFAVIDDNDDSSIADRERYLLTHELSHVFLPTLIGYSELGIQSFRDPDKDRLWWKEISSTSYMEIEAIRVFPDYYLKGTMHGPGTGIQSSWKQAYWSKMIAPYDGTENQYGITEISVDYEFDFLDKMGTIALEGWNTETGKRTFLIRMHDSWTGSKAKPNIYAYDTNGDVISGYWVGGHIGSSGGSGEFSIVFNAPDDIELTLHQSGSFAVTKHFEDDDDVGITNEIRLMVQANAHVGWFSSSEIWKLENYVEAYPIFIDDTYHHDTASYEWTDDCYSWQPGYKEVTIMWPTFTTFTGNCWLSSTPENKWWYSDFNEALLITQLNILPDA